MTLSGEWPIEYREQLLLGDPRSNLAICCLWTPKDRIRTLLDASRYCVVGNLYSRAGINAMLRNILANPVIRVIAVTGKSATDTDDALLEFFRSGIDHQWKIINNRGQIDPGLPLDAIEQVRQNVRLIDLRDSQNLATDLESLAVRSKTLPPFAEPRLFESKLSTPETYPSESIGFLVRGESVEEVWEEIIWTIMTFGHVTPTDYGLEQRESLALLSVIRDAKPHPKGLPKWAPFTDTDIETYIRGFFNSRQTDDFAYNYGYRLASHWRTNQVENLVAELQRSKHSRRAVAILWDPVMDSGSSDPPCITAIQASVREGYLYLMAYIRSNDMFRAYPLNAFALGSLQERIASGLADVSIGPLTIMSLSAHIYSDCWDTCQGVAVAFQEHNWRFHQDPRGSFVFSLDDAQVSVEHYSPAGDLLKRVTARDVDELERAVLPFVDRADHLMYLGRELQRLRSCQVAGEPYVQDAIRAQGRGR